MNHFMPPNIHSFLALCMHIIQLYQYACNAIPESSKDDSGGCHCIILCWLQFKREESESGRHIYVASYQSPSSWVVIIPSVVELPLYNYSSQWVHAETFHHAVSPVHVSGCRRVWWSSQRSSVHTQESLTACLSHTQIQLLTPQIPQYHTAPSHCSV